MAVETAGTEDDEGSQDQEPVRWHSTLTFHCGSL